MGLGACVFVVKAGKQMSCAWLVASAESSLLASGRVLASSLGLGPEHPLVIELRQKKMPAGVGSFALSTQTLKLNSVLSRRCGASFVPFLFITRGKKQKQRCIHLIY